jgi:hypothetical protein
MFASSNFRKMWSAFMKLRVKTAPVQIKLSRPPPPPPQFSVNQFGASANIWNGSANSAMNIFDTITMQTYVVDRITQTNKLIIWEVYTYNFPLACVPKLKV